MQHSTQSDSLGWPQSVPPDKPCRQSIHIFKRRQKKGSAFLAGGGGRGAGGAPVSPSATARSAAGVLDRPVSARPRFFYRSTRDRFVFPKIFFVFSGRGGGVLSAGFLRPCTKCPENFLFFLWLVCGGELQQVTCDTARRRSVTERQ